MSSGAALTAHNPSVSFDRVQDEEFSIEGTIREVRWPDEGHLAGGRIIAILAGKGLSVLGRCETPLREGDRIRAIGKKSSLKPNPYRKDAQDFHATVIIALPPKDHDARVRLLQREGVSQQTAEKVVDHFGEDVFQILRQEPKRLEEIPRLRQGTREKILRAAQRFIDEKVAIIALSVGVATERAFEIAANWDWRTIQKQPYCLVRDLSFGTADKIARKVLGDIFAEFGEERILAAIIGQLKKAANDGNCGAPVEKVVAYLRRNYAFSQPPIDAAINRGIELGELARDQWRGKEVLFDEVKYRSEARLFDELCEHQSLDLESGYCRDEVFKEIRNASPMVLTPEQEAAIYNALHEPISIITGGPGTGKTTIIKTLAALVASKNISACALAGRAAFRIQEAAGVEADTIHQLIMLFPDGGRFPQYRFSMSPLIKTSFLVVDECSMIDIWLLRKLLKECSAKTHIVLLGDVDQLGPISAGQPFADMIASGTTPVTRLDRVFRFAEGGEISAAAKAINTGAVSSLLSSAEQTEFVFIPCTDPETGQNIIIELATHTLPGEGYSPDDIQILSPIKKPGVLCGCRELNAELRKRLNRPEHRVVVGDRVIQTRNDRERNIFNGELGIVARTDDEGFDVIFGDRRVVFNKQHFANRLQGPTKDLNWANAITVHKAQGSEFPVVIIPVFSAFSIMLARNLYYTAVSRGQKKVIMVGDPAALNRASLNLRGKQRISKLAEFLNPERDWEAFADEERRVDYTDFDAIDPEALSRPGHHRA